MANFSALQTEAEALVEIWGYGNTAYPPVWAAEVNQAYYDICWEADAIRGPEQSFLTVANQVEYNLPAVITGNANDWKLLLDCWYASAYRVHVVDEAYVRRYDPYYTLVSPTGQPWVCWMPRPNTLRFYPPTANAGDTVTIYGIQSPSPLVNPTDLPVIEAAYHEGIAERAAFYVAKRYAKSADQMAALQERQAIMTDYMQRLKMHVGQLTWPKMLRFTYPPTVERTLV